LFKCSYTLDKSGALTCGKEIKISSKNCTVASFSYCRLTKEIVVSEKIQDVFQLFIYDIQTMKKNRITSSFIHKQDPSFSPSGSWISYVAFDEKKNERYVEMINVYTKKNVRITDTPGCYVSPTWIRKI
jgi:Tol biopolymer transport system component